jgi:uncharacterized membrane protein YkvI
VLSFMNSRFFRVYVIPGAVFQSVLVGGGYGTGREIVEFFTRFGALGGLLGIVVTWVCWAIVLGITYEFARRFGTYNYRDFFRALLGRAWIAFEILFVVMFLLVLAVVASAAGEIFRESFGIPYLLGLLIMLSVVGVLTFFGREVVTRSLAVWTFLIYITFAIYFVIAFGQLGDGIRAQMAEGEMGSGWWVSGIQYAMYNLFIVPVILYSVRDIRTRREAAASAVVASSICILPALLFHLTFLGVYPDVVAWEIPLFSVISELAVAGLLGLYLVMLFGTLIETGAGLLQGLNERIDGYLMETRGISLSKLGRSIVAVSGIAVSAVLATAGIIALIARGYGTIAWGFLIVYVVPVCTVGVWKLLTEETDASSVMETEARELGSDPAAG